MNLVDEWGITLAVFLPLVGAVVIALTPKGMDGIQKILALASTGAALVVGLMVAFAFEHGEAGLQFEKTVSWIPSIDANYHVGVDGISLPLIVMSLLVTFLCIVYAYWHIPEPGKTKAFLALILLLETGMNGSFIALDLVLFFVFWELVLVPMYFLIGIWGGENRQYAAIKFFLYTLFGSIFMLLGFLALYFQSDPNTFDIVELQQAGVLTLPVGLANLIFAGLALGFAVKVPMWPFHTWLPDAHTQAPTIGSVLLAAVLLKMGTYGFMRIAIPILPEQAQTFAPVIAILAAIAIVYGALCCLAQTNLKRMIAFSSVGHMGFVMLGIATLTPEGFNAAVFGMVAHGVVTGMLFFLAGSIKERYHTYEMPELAGMGLRIPRMAGLLAFCAIASLGLPGLAGFWGEVMALLASFQPLEGLNLTVFRTAMVIGGIGTVLTAGYFLWMLQRVNMGKEREGAHHGRLLDVSRLEYAAWLPLLALILILGLYPRLIMDTTTSSVTRLTETITGQTANIAQVDR
jgi:NADH-quinone oxidoreductase subunit M